ncbi:MAG: phosphodiester glycosidase family protein [Firmicutes bacterium]|nr:phosphodiester glycosidase family protein [Bacillota bacterium]
MLRWKPWWSVLTVLLMLWGGVPAHAASGDSPPCPLLPTTTLTAWPEVRTASCSPPTTVTAGVVHQSARWSTSEGPLQANVLTVDLSNPNVRVGVAEAHDHLLQGPETLSAMADRTGAVAGINGDDFAITGSGKPVGMVAIDGSLWQSPLSGIAVLGVTASGKMVIAPESFSGTVMAEQSSYPLGAVNRLKAWPSTAVTLFTPALGAPVTFSSPATVAFLVPDPTQAGRYTVSLVEPRLSQLETLHTHAVLAAPMSSPASQWMQAHLHPGDPVQIQERLDPGPSLVSAIGGGPIILQDGHWVNLPSTIAAKAAPDALNPLTAVGVDQSGTKAFFVVFDGRQPALSVGATYRQAAEYLKSLGAYSAMLFDGGGSSEMVVRQPGDQQVTVVNSPSDGKERPVANGLFVYSTHQTPGMVNQLVVNHDQPVTLLQGTAVPISAYLLDQWDNPLSDLITFAVAPPDLATPRGHQLIAGKPGSGRLWAEVTNTPFPAETWIPLQVVSHLAALSLTPPVTTLSPGQSVTFSVYGIAEDGSHVPLPASAITWHLQPSALGTITPSGVFTAGSGVGWATISASAGGATAVARVAVGTVSAVVDLLTDPAHPWVLHAVGASGQLTLDTAQPPDPTAKGSLALQYQIASGPGVKQLVLYPKDTVDQISASPAGWGPEAVSAWVYGDGSGLWMAAAFVDGAGHSLVLYPTYVTFTGWHQVEIPIPPGTPLPLQLQYLDFLVINPAQPLQGTLELGPLEALYPPPPPNTG